MKTEMKGRDNIEDKEQQQAGGRTTTETKGRDDGEVKE